MKKTSIILVLLAVSVLPITAYAGWFDLLKGAAQDEELQKKVMDTAVGTAGKTTDLSIETLISGLKEALEVGSRRAIEEISQPGGYLDNQNIRIPLPEGINQVSTLLKKYGLEDQVNQFEESMNRAAEKAAPQATELIINAVKSMSIEDAKKIYAGKDDAATEYFKEKTSAQLKALFQPSVKASLGQVGTTRYYDDLAGMAKDIPFIGDKVNIDLDNYVTDQALTGLFTMLAAEEKKIRENPAARTTDLLKKVFQ